MVAEENIVIPGKRPGTFEFLLNTDCAAGEYQAKFVLTCSALPEPLTVLVSARCEQIDVEISPKHLEFGVIPLAPGEKSIKVRDCTLLAGTRDACPTATAAVRSQCVARFSTHAMHCIGNRLFSPFHNAYAQVVNNNGVPNRVKARVEAGGSQCGIDIRSSTGSDKMLLQPYAQGCFVLKLHPTQTTVGP